jgi:hypothetical protein
MASSMQYLRGRRPGEDKDPDILAQATWTLQQVCLLCVMTLHCTHDIVQYDRMKFHMTLQPNIMVYSICNVT